MRLVIAVVLLIVLWMSPVFIGDDRAAAVSVQPQSGTTLVERAKIVCGDTPEGYRCKREGGAIRRGKMPDIPDSGTPSAPSGGSSGGSLWGGGGGGLWGGGSLWGGNKNEAPASAPSGGTGSAAAGGCPPNSEPVSYTHLRAHET